ncbi:hypothetical protein [Limnoglobus roseus]|uniref:hypothetical protein n=1 Tax=Limnoglobus roseus TaxID=2598579 RepID=UPI00143DF297|nr:hypothetical protein [Limnoglobus roseus]
MTIVVPPAGTTVVLLLAPLAVPLVGMIAGTLGGMVAGAFDGMVVVAPPVTQSKFVGSSGPASA